LEKRYPDCFGLNLTYEFARRSSNTRRPEGGHPDEFDPNENPALEGQLVNWPMRSV